MDAATLPATHPAESPETQTGRADLPAVADGAILTHVLTEEERSRGVLAVDGDLELWARLAEEGLPRCGGGALRTRWAQTVDDLPHDASIDLAAPTDG